jgi:O-antigen/teichoic acid export membrane protein
MTGHERRCVRVFGWSALLNVGLSVAGVWAFGALGAALASLATTILWNAWLRVLVARHVGVRPTIVDALLDALRRFSSLRST